MLRWYLRIRPRLLPQTRLIKGVGEWHGSEMCKEGDTLDKKNLGACSLPLSPRNAPATAALGVLLGVRVPDLERNQVLERAQDAKQQRLRDTTRQKRRGKKERVQPSDAAANTDPRVHHFGKVGHGGEQEDDLCALCLAKKDVTSQGRERRDNDHEVTARTQLLAPRSPEDSLPGGCGCALLVHCSLLLLLPSSLPGMA